jgi:O-antigen ligase
VNQHRPVAATRALEYLALAGVVLLGVWPSITPLGGAPYFRFERDWIAFLALMLFVAPTLALFRLWPGRIRINLLSGFAASLLVIASLQWMLGRLGAVPTATLTAMAYPVGLMLAGMAGAGWRGAGRSDALAGALGAGIVLGGVCNAVAMIAQFFEQESWFIGYLARTEDPTRMNGLLGQSNLAATFLMLASWVLIRADQRVRSQPMARPALRLGVLLLMTGLVMANSRTAVIELAVVTLGLWWLHRREPVALYWRLLPLQYLLALGLVYACALAASHPLGRGLAGFGVGNDSRWQVWQMALEIGARAPWLGAGWREFAHAQIDSALVTVSPLNLDHAHNLLLNLWAETGVLGLGTFVAGLYWWLAHDKPWRETAPVSSMALGLVVILLVHSMTEFPLWWANDLFIFGIAFALLPGTTWRGSWWAALGLASIIGVSLVPLRLDLQRAEAVYRVSGFDAPAVHEAAWAQAVQSWWFSPAVERAALLKRAPLRGQIGQDIAQSARLLHAFPDAGLLTWHLRALVLAGDEAKAMRIAQRMQLVYRRSWCLTGQRVAAGTLVGVEPEFIDWLAHLPTGMHCTP